MAQKTFVDGDVLTASDINTYLMGEGGAWTSYTPQLDQGASTNIAKTVSYSKYARHGRMITWNFLISATAAGTSGSTATLTLPVTAASANGVIGAGRVYDASITTTYTAAVLSGDAVTVIFSTSVATNPSGWGLVPLVAIASGDEFRGSITYEAAS